MGIRHRLLKPEPLLYHKLYGPLQNPPVDRKRVGPEPWPPNGSNGIRAEGLILGVERHRYFPPKLNIKPETVLVGLSRNHDAQRGGIGPGQGFSAWVATAIIVREWPESQFVLQYAVVNPRTGKRTIVSSKELCDLFKFSSRSEPKNTFYLPHDTRGYRTQQELNLMEEALEGMYLDYEELHGVTFPWKAMRYRHTKEA